MIGSSLAVPSLAAINLSKPLDSFAQKSLGKRYYRSKTPRIGSLQPSSSIRKPYSLRNGVNYGFAAVCDQNCTDIDIRLIDENEQVIEEDIDSDNTAVIPYTAEADGTYEVEVIMYGCGSQLRLRFRSRSEEIIMKLIIALGIVLFSATPVLAVDLKNEENETAHS